MPRIRGVAILNNPALAATLPAASQWLQPTFSFTGTSSNGSAAITGITTPYVPANWSTSGNIMPGTSTLIFGPGFPATGTTVASITSATAIAAAINATTALGAGTGVFTVTSVGAWQSSFAGNWPGYMQPAYATADIPVGALLEPPFALPTLFANSAVTLPPGDLNVSVVSAGTTAVVIQMYSNNAWVTQHSYGITAITSQVYVPSDGANWRLLVGAANPPTGVTITQFR